MILTIYRNIARFVEDRAIYIDSSVPVQCQCAFISLIDRIVLLTMQLGTQYTSRKCSRVPPLTE